MSTALPSLTPDELSIVHSAARPLQPQAVEPFIAAVAERLHGYRELGPGVIFRIAREVQREFFDPPKLNGRTGAYNKYAGR